MTITTTLSGTITIGEAPNTVEIPVETTIPPSQPNDFILDFSRTDPATAPHIPVGSYIAWAADQLGVSGLVDDDLPGPLQNVTVAVMKLHIDSTGPFDVEVQLGTLTGGQWSSTWKPVSALPLELSGLTLQVTNIPPANQIVIAGQRPAARVVRTRTLAQA
jgi:hypothetical protein